MTRYFEVHQRDGAARTGSLYLNNTIPTPAVIDPSSLKPEAEGDIIYPGSQWHFGNGKAATQVTLKLRERVGKNKLIIMPSCTYSSMVAGDVTCEKIDVPADEGPTGIAYSERDPETTRDLYVADGIGCHEGNPRRLLADLMKVRKNIAPDSALYAPNIALPENVAMLIYLGVDILDTTRATIAAFEDKYMTSAGFIHLDRLAELPCCCAHCSGTSAKEVKDMDKKQRARLLEKHNIAILEAEVALVRQRIRSASLREYVEGRCRHNPALVAMLRLSDAEYDFLEERTALFKPAPLLATTSESLTRPEVVRFARRVQQRYTPPEKDVLLLLPCSARKPYSISMTHSRFRKALGKNLKLVQEVIITSPLGVVPRELEVTYPAAHYDTTVTGYWDAEEHRWVGECLENFLLKHPYKHIVAHVEDEYRSICENVSKKLGLEITYTSDGNVTSQNSLHKLEDTMKELCNGLSYRGDYRRDMLKAIADYQFGVGCGEALLPPDSKIKAPFPRYQAFLDKEQLITLIPENGTIALTIEGAKRIIETGNYVVNIDDFVPRGSILAPGVIDADERIRPNDEVFICGDKAFCVGRAAMSGPEMIHSNRGIAVDVRHVKKL
jgi:archaeosine synthase